MEEVLSGIVESITGVLLVFEDAKSSTKKKLTVNTTNQLGKAVDMLIDLAKKVSSNFLPEFKLRMEEMIEDMQSSANILHSFSLTIIEDTDNEVIIGEIKKILIDSVKMMKIQDESRVKNIVISGKTAADTVRRLNKVENFEQLLTVGGDLNQHLSNLATLLSRRITQIANPAITSALRDATDVIAEYTPKIILTTKDVIENEGDAEMLQLKKDAYSNLINGISSAMSAVARSASFLQAFDVDYFFPGGNGYRRPIDPNLLARIAKLKQDIQNKLGDLQYTTKSGQKLNALQIKEFSEFLDDQLKAGRELAEKIDNPIKQQQLLEACDALEKIFEGLGKTSKALLSNPDDPKYQQDYLQLAEQAKLLAAQVHLASLNAMIDHDLQRVLDALNIGDEIAAKEAAQKLSEDLLDYVNTAKTLAGQLPNLQQKQRLLEKAAVLESLIDKIVPSVVSVAKNPDNTDLRKALEHLLKDIQETTDQVSFLGLRPIKHPEAITMQDLPQRATAEERDAVKAGQDLNIALDKLLLSARLGDRNETEKSLKEAEAELRNLINKAKKVAEHCTDPVLKKQLLDLINQLENQVLPGLLKSGADFLKDPKNLSLLKKLEEMIENARGEASKVTALVKKCAEFREAESRRALKAIDARVPKDMAEALTNILLAANATQFGEDTPQGKLISVSKLISEELEKLSISNDKAEMIKSSRAIAAAIADVKKWANDIATRCNNPKLKQALLNAAGVPQNFSTQLKILAAVKASTSDKDIKSANIQLFDCAKRLAMSVTNVIEAAEVAAIACL